MVLNTGVWLSDITCIIVAYYGASELMHPISNNIIFKLIAGGAFLFFGWSYFLRKPSEEPKPLGGVGVLIFWFGR